MDVQVLQKALEIRRLQLLLGYRACFVGEPPKP